MRYVEKEKGILYLLVYKLTSCISRPPIVKVKNRISHHYTKNDTYSVFQCYSFLCYEPLVSLVWYLYQHAVFFFPGGLLVGKSG